MSQATSSRSGLPSGNSVRCARNEKAEDQPVALLPTRYLYRCPGTMFSITACAEGEK